ncbi:accessory Sec system translocase SecA2 [Paenibacillus sp. N3.4]|uniref:preprotein translocase subunit SecA n=1 Tax=Paenibacillus sp. N3.4 TaxID=2603222 RepID=UPI0011C8724F|nr:accessory Sec system translocase SecA2 [Paenibacillus sp. N3.4]TXK70853.1 accessory Sec system translocase SecA2 [Paenibacillus sp. N3.4]
MLSAWKQWTKVLVSRESVSTRKTIRLINQKYDLMRYIPESELMKLTERLRVELEQSTPPDYVPYVAVALVKEAVRRKMGLIMHDEQLLSGYEMMQGKVVEMLTGEGKTLASLIPVFWYGLHSKGVHMITVNPYLAERDYLQARDVCQILGMSVGLNQAGLHIEEKQAVYRCDVTYGTWSEFGFDYLRDHLVFEPSKQVQRPLAYAIIDEMDSVLIDEAKTPMIIAGKTKASPDLYYICSQFIRGLREQRDYERDVETNQVMFTEAGIRKIEKMFMVDNLFDLEYTTIYHYLLQSLRAHVLMEVDRDYLIKDGKVQIIDSYTGRVMDGREFSDGLHQAIEVKEGLSISEETRSNASITVQKYFSLYSRLIGMSGTIQTDRDELRRIYGLDVLPIPTHKPNARRDAPDLVFASKEAKYKRLVDEIAALHNQGIPILVGTTTVQQSQELADRLSKVNLQCRVLNAKTEREEAEIISHAGLKGGITIATNMAGRGADIRLGEGVAELGGLHVIGLEKHESRRIDLQLRGRSGRQGDPGASQFFISLEDDLFQRYADEEAEVWRDKWKWGEEGNSSKELLYFVEMVQRRAEQQMYEIRSLVYKFDCVVHRQRECFYAQRQGILLMEPVEEAILRSVSFWIKDRVERFCPPDQLPEEWKVELLRQEFGLSYPLAVTDYMTPKEMLLQVEQRWAQEWAVFLEAQTLQQWRSGWRNKYLRLIDECWLDHLELLGFIKQGIHYRALEKRDPAEVYEMEAYHLYLKFERKYQRALSKGLIQEMISQKSLPLYGTA